MAPRGFGRHGTRTAALALVALIVGLAACGSHEQTPVCAAQAALRSAVGAVEGAQGASGSGDTDAVRRQMDEQRRSRAAATIYHTANPAENTIEGRIPAILGDVSGSR